MKRRTVVTAIVTAGVAMAGSLVFAACGGGGKDEASTTSTSKRTTTTTAPVLAPLTGLPDPSGASETRAALNVKVSNAPEARPQSGLDQADVVWEEVVEGGITRFLAMFQSNSPSAIGPVRSVRLTDPGIVWPVGGIFAFSGGAKYALDGINKAPVVLVDESRAGPAMYRDRSRQAPHNLYGKGDALFAKGGTPVPPPALFTYASAVHSRSGALPITAARVGFNGSFAVDWSWDSASRSWLRNAGGRPFMAASGKQIRATNVVVMSVSYRGGVGSMGAEGVLTGEGKVLVLTDGVAIEGRWLRSSVSQVTRFVDLKGAVIPLTAGNTWVEMPDVTYAVTTTAAVAPVTTTTPKVPTKSTSKP
ncbi:unannotated protein [freshwater metagenome]|uniref:Unannotated protein n=1 Tax=freshwater metagenome TaxID=449393 RepID=A0A6J7JCP4_9ZZZZ|nr:DUF3048 domain-containing protein [Actinomycetota bacterium]